MEISPLGVEGLGTVSEKKKKKKEIHGPVNGFNKPI